VNLNLIEASTVKTGNWIITGARMSRIRKEHGYSRAALAGKLGVHPLELCLMEMGYKKPIPEMYECLKGIICANL
jgi:DNA-binding XRE family transcriptional regulator